MTLDFIILCHQTSLNMIGLYKNTCYYRAKPVPQPKPETKWEKFAKEKGITKKKRSRMVYDEEKEEYRPRWGYKRAKAGIEEQAIVEVKAGDDPNVDPWTKAKLAKKERVQKNLKQQQKNKEDGKSPLPFSFLITSNDTTANNNNSMIFPCSQGSSLWSSR